MKERELRKLFENWTTEELDALLVYILQGDHYVGKGRLFCLIIDILREREEKERETKKAERETKKAENTCQIPETVLE